MNATLLTAPVEPTRLEGVRDLADVSAFGAGNLMRKLGATLGRMSRHMQIQTPAALGVDRRDAKRVRYRIDTRLLPPPALLVEGAT